jgi:hypothetical protein
LKPGKLLEKLKKEKKKGTKNVSRFVRLAANSGFAKEKRTASGKKQTNNTQKPRIRGGGTGYFH